MEGVFLKKNTEQQGTLDFLWTIVIYTKGTESTLIKQDFDMWIRILKDTTSCL